MDVWSRSVFKPESEGHSKYYAADGVAALAPILRGSMSFIPHSTSNKCAKFDSVQSHFGALESR